MRFAFTAVTLLCSATVLPSQQTNPDSIRISTADVTRFMHVMDTLATARTYRDSANVIWTEYYLTASPGLRAFIRLRIGSPFELLDQVTARRTYYAHLRSSLAGLSRAEPAIRSAFRSFKELDPGACFADIYYVIGRMNS